ncbi:MAG TPA: S9 family peptidase [Candidatus Kapabacteria bacterium]|nr:S9 family peptidase [Candidatus Kapabacteria bacterium]
MMKHIPLRDFFRNPEKTNFQVAPHGAFISFLAPYESRLNIHVQDRTTGKVRRITNEKQRDIRNYFWKNDATLFYLLDTGGDENHHLYQVALESGDIRDITPFPKVKIQIVDMLTDRPDELLISMNRRVPEAFDVYRLRISTGEMTMIQENPGNIIDWLADHDGALRIGYASDGVNNTLLYRDTEKDEFRPIFTSNFKEGIRPVLFTFDNKSLYAASNIKRDKYAVVTFDPKTVTETGIVFEHPEVDVSDVGHSRKRKILTAVAYETWKRERTFFDNETRGVFAELERQLPGKEIHIADMTLEEDTFIVRTYSDRSLGAYYVYVPASKTLTKLADVSPWLNEDELAEMKPVTYTSRDGLTIHGYLTLPKNHSSKDIPIIVNPHGGPWVRDSWTFNPEVQFLASRGYGVLKVNYRGSTGYGRRFMEAGFKEWGRAMQNDLSDGVLWLIKQGIADPKRVAIYGGSYGGYATLAGMTFTPELYACGIDYVGVSNLFTFMKTIPPYWKPFLEMTYEMVGHPENDHELLKAASPVFHVDKIRAPLFIAQGANDPRVNKDESDQMVEALKKRGIEVPYMVKDNEGHGFHNEENKFEFYEAMEQFLAKHIG